MCLYTYEFYRCGHGYYLLDDTIEYCSNYTLSAYSPEVWTTDMCLNAVVTCAGMGQDKCDQCLEHEENEHHLISEPYLEESDDEYESDDINSIADLIDYGDDGLFDEELDVNEHINDDYDEDDCEDGWWS